MDYSPLYCFWSAKRDCAWLGDDWLDRRGLEPPKPESYTSQRMILLCHHERSLICRALLNSSCWISCYCPSLPLNSNNSFATSVSSQCHSVLWGCLLCGGETYLVGSWLYGGYFVSARLLCALEVWRRIPGWKSSCVVCWWREHVLLYERGGHWSSLYMFGHLALFSYWLSKQKNITACWSCAKVFTISLPFPFRTLGRIPTVPVGTTVADKLQLFERIFTFIRLILITRKILTNNSLVDL